MAAKQLDKGIANTLVLIRQQTIPRFGLELLRR
jgi:hypothetical protein